MKNCVVLHVEDEDAAAYLLRAAIDEAGLPLNIYRVSDGEQALAFLLQTDPYTNARTPDLIFLDLNLPRVDGWSVLHQIKEHEALRGIPVVVLSTSAAGAHKRRALELGARYYVTKPHSFDVFLEEIKTICMNLLPQNDDLTFQNDLRA
ncbi:MAG TPA: response regulator [Bryobacteraceae bacterium]|nr:response regulator [Bryobacteraceae bacterium]